MPGPGRPDFHGDIGRTRCRPITPGQELCDAHGHHRRHQGRLHPRAEAGTHHQGHRCRCRRGRRGASRRHLGSHQGVRGRRLGHRRQGAAGSRRPRARRCEGGLNGPAVSAEDPRRMPVGPRITLMAIVMAMTFPLAGHAQVSTRNDVQDAERSPLFQRKFATDRISASGLDRVHLDNGVVLELKKYVDLTRLDRSGNFKSLMTAAVVDEYLRSTPGYVENVLQLQDRLIIERTMKVALKEGVCRRGNLPASVNELCFAPGSGPLPDETRKYLVGLRAKLDAASPGAEVRNGMTARQLAGMNDGELLEALLNSDDREIRLVSVLPTEVYRSQARADLWDTNRRLGASDFSAAKNAPVATGSRSSRMPVIGNGTGNGTRVFATKYFLTGFTLGREIGDVFEMQIARATPFTDRYFVRFEYEFSVGLGLRFPFSVSVVAQAGNARVRPAVPQGGSPRNAPPPRGRAGESGPSQAGAGNRPVRSATSEIGRAHV